MVLEAKGLEVEMEDFRKSTPLSSKPPASGDSCMALGPTVEWWLTGSSEIPRIDPYYFFVPIKNCFQDYFMFLSLYHVEPLYVP